MTETSRPLVGRTVLVVGAGDAVAAAAALHASAGGAAVVLAGPHLEAIVRTAGLVAATGAVVRVVEPAAPPLLGAALVEAATAALAPPTDAVLAEALFDAPDALRQAVRDLAAALPPAGKVLVAPRGGTERPRVAGRRLADDLLAATPPAR